jgi:hypothetical protein
MIWKLPYMSINQSDQLSILAAVKSSYKHHFLNQKKFLIKKFSAQKISIYLDPKKGPKRD